VALEFWHVYCFTTGQTSERKAPYTPIAHALLLRLLAAPHHSTQKPAGGGFKTVSYTDFAIPA
jgi:hypothetical protein